MPLSGAAGVERKSVQWSGVSLVGSFEQLPKLMPTVFDLYINNAEFRKQFDLHVSQNLVAVSKNHPSLEILIDSQMRQGDDSYALTLALAGESVTSVTIEQTVFVYYTIQALVLVANVSKEPSRQRIVTSYPVQVSFQEAYSDGRVPSPQDRVGAISKIMMGTAGRANLVSEWSRRLSEIQLREREVFITVAPLRILSDAEKQGGFRKDQLESLAFKVSSVVEGNISKAAGIPIVPYSSEGSLNEMTLSFADRGIRAFRKPDPSYLFQINVFGLGSKALEEAMTREKKFAVAYGGGFEVEYFYINPDKNREKLFSVRLQSVQSMSYLGRSRDSRKASDSDMFSRLISAFSDELSSNLIPANLKWIERSKASSEPRSPQEIVNLISTKLPAPKK